jgi:hypothetical protein
MTSRILVALLAAGAAACATEAPNSVPDPFEGISTGNPLELPRAAEANDGREGEEGGVIFRPVSAPIQDGVAYRFTLGHCGLHSPVDVDGSFWDAIDGLTMAGDRLDLELDGEMINATSGVIVVIGDELRFRTESGSVVRFGRHDGEKEFPMCM